MISRMADSSIAEKPSLSRLRKILPRVSKRSETLSPYTVGTVETRMSISSPLMRTLMRPSWGSRFSAMFIPDMTLMREMMAAW